MHFSDIVGIILFNWEVTKELKIITAETAFIIRTFFFLLFGFSIDLNRLVTSEVILIGLAVIATTVLLRLIFFSGHFKNYLDAPDVDRPARINHSTFVLHYP